ncbi:CLUMA_CG000853, isoform A [Clunio marinus]|uniref:CLUMA_CG000853, isoform A n=1 Tax=Clunio marinus TaxID=568069 RepID=A0A1J1HLD1_9DIPT|nr:CLUMA_CG000853, isoform A [Clunio marinus]
MKSFFIACCLIAVASAQWNHNNQWNQNNRWNNNNNNWHQPPRQDIVREHLPNGQVRCRLRCDRSLRECPIVACPRDVIPSLPPLDSQCPVINCMEDAHRHFVFPHPDPNWFYQCQLANADGLWTVLTRPCGCQTLFSYNDQRCVHPREWVRQCNASPVSPVAAECALDCPDCNGNGQVPPPIEAPPVIPPPVIPPPIEGPPPNQPPNGCPCMPCIWWPCVPCSC